MNNQTVGDSNSGSNKIETKKAIQSMKQRFGSLRKSTRQAKPYPN